MFTKKIDPDLEEMQEKLLKYKRHMKRGKVSVAKDLYAFCYRKWGNKWERFFKANS